MRSEPHCGRGVPRAGLEQEVVEQPRIDRTELAADENRLAGGGDGDHALRRSGGENPPSRDLQKQFVAEEFDQMFGKIGAAQGPQAGARAPGQEHGHEGDIAGRAVLHP